MHVRPTSKLGYLSINISEERLTDARFTPLGGTGEK